MIETDRRSLIAGAVATLFAGVAPAAIEKAAAALPPQPETTFGVAAFRSSELWQQIYENVSKAYTEIMGEPAHPRQLAFVELFSDSVYYQIKNMEAVIDSITVTTTSPGSLEDWAREQHLLSQTDITIKVE